METASGLTASVAPRAKRRREATDRKLMKATLQIAVERGISGVTIEEVARRSGVAKTTIYRRYHNANDLLREISARYLVHDMPTEPPSPTREHFTQMLRQLVDWVQDNDIDIKSVGIVLSSEAEFFRHIVDQVVTPWLEMLTAFLRRGGREGVFRQGLDGRLLLSTIIGSLVAYEAIGDTGAVSSDWMHAPVDGATGATDATDVKTLWADHMADLLWPALLK